jgi:hypothetical protein
MRRRSESVKEGEVGKGKPWLPLPVIVIKLLTSLILSIGLVVYGEYSRKTLHTERVLIWRYRRFLELLLAHWRFALG